MLIKLKERFLITDMLDGFFYKIPLSTLRELYETLAVSDDEISDKGITTVKEFYEWKRDDGKEICIPKDIKKMICDVLKIISKKGKVIEEWEGLYELFLGEG